MAFGAQAGEGMLREVATEGRVFTLSARGRDAV